MDDTTRHPPTAVLGLAASLGLAGCIDTGVSAKGNTVTDPVIVEESFAQAPLPQVDVLWVVDNTCSMAEEQAALSGAFSTFAGTLDELGLSWQAGVVTTDVAGEDAGVLQGNPWIIHADMADPAAAFAQAADVGTDPAATQAGLGAAWLALSDDCLQVENRGFRRPGASLHVVIVSDGDDDSSSVLGADPALAFEDFLAQDAARTGLPAVLSAVVGDVPDGCATALPGTSYVDVAQASGGAVASICAADFGSVSAAIGEASISWPDTFVLQELPKAGTVKVWFDDTRADDGSFSIDESVPALVFVDPPPPGVTIRVRYELPEAGA